MTIYTLPIPPSTNALYIYLTKKKRIKTPEYTAWITEAGWALKAQKAKHHASPVGIVLFVPYYGIRDVSNYLKATEDLLKKHGVITNDNMKHVQRITLEVTEEPDFQVSVITLPVRKGKK